MAFWGVEVKPGKPITHSCEKARGRLRISQATLGLGQASTDIVVVQCKVGNRRPVSVCAFQPKTTLSSQLDLEFEEADDVVFSVFGPQSVYLAGYYVQRNQQSNPHSDTESYGVDIENTQTDGSSYHSDDDVYEDSFIDDDDKIKVSPHSPVLSSKGLDETTLENGKTKERKGHGKRLKKKCQIIESDNDANSHEGGSLSDFKSERVGKTTTSDVGEKIAQATEEMDDEAKDDSAHANESKQKPDPLDVDGKLEREKESSFGEEKTGMIMERNELPKEVEILEKIVVSSQRMIHGNKEDISINPNLPGSDGKDQLQSLYLEKSNELPKEVETLQEIIVPIQDVSQGNNTKDTRNNQNLPVSDGKDQLQSLDLTKPKKKRKVRSVKKGKTSKVQTDKDHSVFGEDKEHEVEASTNLEIGENCLVTSPELGSINGQKSKKRRKELQLEGSNTEGADEKCLNIPEEDIWEQVLLVADIMTKDLPAANGEYEGQQSLEEKTSMEGLGAKCHNAPREDEVMQECHPDSPTEELPVANGESLAHQIDKEDEVMQERHADSKTKELPAANGENLEQQIDNNISIKSELLANDNQHNKIKKKKKKKTQGERSMNLVATEMTDNQESMPVQYEDQGTKTGPLQKTLSNGLIIEELVSGPRNGKVAVPGKQVKIFYTAMLKESGHVYDSNVGEAAFKYHLGDESYIDGWNIGIQGMRVGDKRRLTIPPSMGYGETGVENVPPNSWLIYDIELVGVRK